MVETHHSIVLMAIWKAACDGNPYEPNSTNVTPDFAVFLTLNVTSITLSNSFVASSVKSTFRFTSSSILSTSWLESPSSSADSWYSTSTIDYIASDTSDEHLKQYRSRNIVTTAVISGTVALAMVICLIYALLVRCRRKNRHKASNKGIWVASECDHYARSELIGDTLSPYSAVGNPVQGSTFHNHSLSQAVELDGGGGNNSSSGSSGSGGQGGRDNSSQPSPLVLESQQESSPKHVLNHLINANPKLVVRPISELHSTPLSSAAHIVSVSRPTSPDQIPQQVICCTSHDFCQTVQELDFTQNPGTTTPFDLRAITSSPSSASSSSSRRAYPSTTTTAHLTPVLSTPHNPTSPAI